MNGIIIITTKNESGRADNIKKSNGDVGSSFQGYYLAHDFYSPAYSVSRSEIPDFRTTIYWEPLLETDKNGNTTFQYFNASSKGNYRVVVGG